MWMIKSFVVSESLSRPGGGSEAKTRGGVVAPSDDIEEVTQHTCMGDYTYSLMCQAYVLPPSAERESGLCPSDLYL